MTGAADTTKRTGELVIAGFRTTRIPALSRTAGCWAASATGRHATRSLGYRCIARSAGKGNLPPYSGTPLHVTRRAPTRYLPSSPSGAAMPFTLSRRGFLATSAAATLAERLAPWAPGARPLPTAAQLAWQRDELTLFAHFGM